jgi:hypothetical protein
MTTFTFSRGQSVKASRKSAFGGKIGVRELESRKRRGRKYGLVNSCERALCQDGSRQFAKWSGDAKRFPVSVFSPVMVEGSTFHRFWTGIMLQGKAECHIRSEVKFHQKVHPRAKTARSRLLSGFLNLTDIYRHPIHQKVDVPVQKQSFTPHEPLP